MIRSNDYLKQAKLEELERRYTNEGFKVTRPRRGDDRVFDLVARKGGRTVGVFVRALGSLGGSKQDARAAHELARKKNYDFRLVVVPQPKIPDIDIEGLDELLLNRLSNADLYEAWDLPPKLAHVDDVHGLEVDSVVLAEDGVSVSGSGEVSVTMEFDGGEENDGITLRDTFPFTFDITLDKNLKLKEVHELKVDTSMYWGESDEPERED